MKSSRLNIIIIPCIIIPCLAVLGGICVIIREHNIFSWLRLPQPAMCKGDHSVVLFPTDLSPDGLIYIPVICSDVRSNGSTVIEGSGVVTEASGSRMRIWIKGVIKPAVIRNVKSRIVQIEDFKTVTVSSAGPP